MRKLWHYNINRDILECKVLERRRKRRKTDNINRDILECKVDNMTADWNANAHINRDILECKGLTALSIRNKLSY